MNRRHASWAMFLSAGLACSSIVALGLWLETGRDTHGRGLLAGLCLGFAGGMLLAVLELLAWLALRRPLGRLGLSRFVDPARDAPRKPVVDLHAALLGLGAGALLVAAGTRLALALLRSIEAQELYELLVMAAVLVQCLLVFGGVVLLWPLRALLVRLDERVGLPWPRSSALRRIVWGALPLGLAAGLGLSLLGDDLEHLSWPLWLGAAVSLQLVLHPLVLLGGRLPGWPERGRALGVAALALLGGLALLGAHVILDGHPKAAAQLESNQPAAQLLALARSSADLDGDGASAWFGEQDCAPWSAARAPALRDVPNNGIDEDCDGKDARGASLPGGPVYYRDPPVAVAVKPDIVWFVIDALRADHTSLLGYKQPTTPELDALARESTVFTRAYAQSSATMLSFPSMLTGVDPARLSWHEVRNRLQLDPKQRHVGEHLAPLGYKLGFVAHHYFKGRLPGLLRGWPWVRIPDARQANESSSAAALAATFVANARQSPSPFMLVVYLPGPHAPYVSHGPGYPSFPDTPLGRYDVEIHDTDRQLGFVLEVLRQDKKRWANTIVVVNADHGEEFMEHGGKAHGRNCHVESLHVPLVVRMPGHKPGRVEQPVGLVDVVPTLIELTSAPRPRGAAFDGHSLLLAKYQPERVSAERPLFCSAIGQSKAEPDYLHRSAQSGQWKLMRDLRSAQPPKLYDIRRDPGERAPVVLDEKTERIAWELGRWLNLQATGNLLQAKLVD